MKKLVNFTQFCSLTLILFILGHFGYQDVILNNQSMDLIWSTIIGIATGSLGVATTLTAQKFGW